MAPCSGSTGNAESFLLLFLNKFFFFLSIFGHTLQHEGSSFCPPVKD